MTNKMSNYIYTSYFLFHFSFAVRSHTFMTCDNQGNNNANSDYSCFYGEGICVKQQVMKPLLCTSDGSAHHSSKQMSDYQTMYVSFTTGCSCQLIKNSVFSVFAS